MPDAIVVTKFVTRTIVGFGATRIAKAIIQNNIQPESTVQAVEIGAATAVLGMVVSDAARKHTDKFIDEIVDTVKKIKNKAQEETATQE